MKKFEQHYIIDDISNSLISKYYIGSPNYNIWEIMYKNSSHSTISKVKNLIEDLIAYD